MDGDCLGVGVHWRVYERVCCLSAFGDGVMVYG